MTNLVGRCVLRWSPMCGGEQHTREAKESVGREIDSSQTLEMKHTDHTI